MHVVLLDAGEPERLSAYTSGHVELEPIGLAYLAGTLEANGHSAAVLLRARDQSLVDYATLALGQSPQLVGISVLTYAAENAKTLADIVKSADPSVAVVVGGSHPSCVPDFVDHPSFDYAVVGEGERSLLALADKLETGAEAAVIPGLVRKDGEGLATPRDPVRNLDSLAWPVRTGEYRSAGLLDRPLGRQRGIAQVSYSRGCINRCAYCSSRAIFGDSVRWRAAAGTVDEIDWLMSARGIDLVYFTDLTFNSDRSRVLALCNEIQRRCPDLRWMCGCRADMMDEELIRGMSAAGCVRIHYGIESADEQLLRRLGRRQSLERARSILKATHRAGIIVRGYLMLGYPRQTREALRELPNFLRSLAIDDLRVSFYTPFPGTPAFQDAERNDLLSTRNLSLYTTDEPVVRVPGVAREELLEVRSQLFATFYKSHEYRERMQEKLAINPHLKEAYEDFLASLIAQGVVESL